MRIAVVNSFFPPRVGGSAHLSEALARGYAAHGHDVLVLTASYADAPAREERDGLRIVRLPAATVPSSRLSVSFDIAFTARPGAYGSVSALLGAFRPDVVHQHGQFFDLTWLTGWWAHRHGVPVLLSVHTRLENPVAAYRGVFRSLDAVLVRPALRAYRPRVVVMDALMQDYITTRYAGAYAGLEHIPVGVDPDVAHGRGRRAGPGPARPRRRPAGAQHRARHPAEGPGHPRGGAAHAAAPAPARPPPRRRSGLLRRLPAAGPRARRQPRRAGDRGRGPGRRARLPRGGRCRGARPAGLRPRHREPGEHGGRGAGGGRRAPGQLPRGPPGQRAGPRAGPRGRPRRARHGPRRPARLPGSAGARRRRGQQLVRQRFSIAEVLRQHLEVLGRMAGR